MQISEEVQRELRLTKRVRDGDLKKLRLTPRIGRERERMNHLLSIAEV